MSTTYLRRLFLGAALLFSMSSTMLFGQNEAAIWHFAQSVQLDFRSEPPTSNCNSSINTAEGSAVVASPSGTLFYTDGREVWDGSNNTLPNGTGLLGDPSSSSSGFIIPDPANADRYYLFSVGGGDDVPSGNRDVVYSMVDMSVPEVITSTRNTPFPNIGNSSEKITATPSSTFDGFWVVLPSDYLSNTLSVFRLDATGLAATPTSTYTMTRPSTGQGYMKFNQQGNMLGISVLGANPGRPGVSTIQFNPATGQFVNGTEIHYNNFSNDGIKVYGLEFSPNGNYMYFTTLAPGRLIELDISNGTTTELLSATTFRGGAVQLAPNGKIYFTHPTGLGSPNDALTVIHDPNQDGGTPDVDFEGQQLACAGANLGLPTFLPSLVGTVTCVNPGSITLTANEVDFCEGTVSATLTATDNATYAYFWIDNSTGDTIQQGVGLNEITVNTEGTYSVIVSDPLDLTDLNCSSTSNLVTITEHDDPVITGSITGPLEVCEGATGVNYELTGQNLSGLTVQWQPLNNGATYSSATTANPVTVSFAGVTNFATDVAIGVQLSETNGNAVCTSDVSSIDVDVVETPTIDVNTTDIDVACNSTGNTITITNFDANLNYSISTTGGITANRNNGTISFSVGETNGTIVVSTETSGTAACPADADVTIDVTVNGCGIRADFETNFDAVCTDGVITLTSTSFAGGGNSNITSYVWDFDPSANVTVVNSNANNSIIDIQVTNTTTNPLDIQVTHTVTNNWNQTDDTVAVSVITVNPSPVNFDIDFNGVLCEGDTAQFEIVNTFDPTTTYTWTTNPVQTQVLPNIGPSIRRYSNSGVPYVVTVTPETDQNCPGDPVTFDVDAELNPVLNFDTAVTVLCNSTNNLIDLPAFTGNYIITSVSEPSLTANIVGNQLSVSVLEDGGVIRFIQESNTGNACQSEDEGIVTITVIGCNLRASFTADESSCANDTIRFTSTSDPGAGATVINYDWIFNPASAVQIVNAATDSTWIEVVMTNTGSTSIPVDVTLFIETSLSTSDDTVSTAFFTIFPNPGTIDIEQTVEGSICVGSDNVFTVNPLNTSSQYIWNDGSTLNNVNADTVSISNTSNPYTVTVQEIDTNGCVGPIDSVDVIPEELPVLSINDTTVTCSAQNQFVLIDNYDPNSTYSFTDTNNVDLIGIVNDTIYFNGLTADGSFSVQQETANGCLSNIETVNVTVIGCGIIAIFEVSNENGCSGDTILLDGSLSEAGEGTTITDYDWTLPNGFTIVNSSADEDSLWVVVENLGSTPDTVTVTLTVTSSANLTDDTIRTNVFIINPLPQDPVVTANGGTCPGDTVVFLVSPYSSNLNVDWTYDGLFEVADSLVVINPSGDYSVGVSVIDNNSGCPASDSAAINRIVTQPPLITSITGIPDTVCPSTAANSNYNLSATVIGADSLFWSTDPMLGVFTRRDTSVTSVQFGTETESVRVTLQAFSDGCDAFDEDFITVYVDTSYNVFYSISGATVCVDEANTYRVDISGDIPVNEPVNYLWVLNDSDTISFADTAFIESLNAEDYLELYVDGDFCSSTISDFYDSIPLPYVLRPGALLSINEDIGAHVIEEVFIIPDIELEDEISIADRQLGLFSQPNQWEFYWYNPATDSLTIVGIDDPIRILEGVTDATPPNFLQQQSYDVTYWLYTENDFCRDSSSAVLTISFDIFIPNVFTPNDDGFYDTWVIENGDKYGPVKVQIFNRWGNLVYNNDNYADDWVGQNNNGSELPFGTYFYILETGVESMGPFRGTVTIMK